MNFRFKREPKDVIVNFAGGLGNQLFQYAYFCYLLNLGISVKCNFGTLPIRLDSKGRPWFEGLSVDAIYLKETNILKKILYKIIIYTINNSDRHNPSRLRDKTDSHFSIIRHFLNVLVIREVGFSSELESVRNGNIFAYCQTDYWVKNLDVNRHFKFPRLTQDFYEIAEHEKPLVVHVRMGDYEDNPQIGILGSTYYLSSIRNALQNYDHKAIWLFSDDPVRALTRVPLEFRDLVRIMDSPEDTPLETLEKMRLGSGYILANSSLSWWGAYLSYNNGVRVLVPTPWFRTLVDPNQLIPSSWEKRNADWESTI